MITALQTLPCLIQHSRRMVTKSEDTELAPVQAEAGVQPGSLSCTKDSQLR
jgi:hypothetical protein